MMIASLTPMSAWGHSTGENYVWLNAQDNHIDGRFSIRLDDLRLKLGIDMPDDFEAAQRRVLETAPQVQDYIRSHFSIGADGERLPILFTETKLFRADRLGHFAEYYYRTPDGAVPDQLDIRNDLLFADDPFHRSLLCIDYNAKTGEHLGAEFTALVFSPTNNAQVLDLTDIRGLLPIRDFVWQGMLHIWIGIDHILFLVALLLPAVLVRRQGVWLPVDGFRPAFWNIIKIVTVFTLAHSITLSLAALGLVQVPSRLVESSIALSIILVALNNIFPIYRRSLLWIVFLFGLVHGLGFATVMGALPFRMQDLLSVLIAFNLGIEIGQVLIVAAVFVLIYPPRKRRFYAEFVPQWGSAMLCVVAGYWFFERALGVS